jgi:hypothetical protein
MSELTPDDPNYGNAAIENVGTDLLAALVANAAKPIDPEPTEDENAEARRIVALQTATTLSHDNTSDLLSAADAIAAWLATGTPPEPAGTGAPADAGSDQVPA